MQTTYLIIPHLRGLELLPKGILCLAAGGGLPSESKLKFVIVGSGSDPKIKKDVDRYSKARCQIAAIREWPQIPECLPSLFLANPTSPTDNSLFETEDIDHTPWFYQNVLEEFNTSNLGDDDLFVVISSTADMRTLSFHNTLCALPGMEQHRNHIQDICIVAYEQDQEAARMANTFRAFRWLQGPHVVFTGVRDDAYRKGMTIMDAIASVINACHNPLSGVPSHEEAVAYTPYDLPSREACDSIMRMRHLYEIRKTTTTADSLLAKWQKNFEIDKRSGLWNSGMPFNAVNDLLDMFNEFFEKIPTDHFSFIQENNTDLISELNSMPSLHLSGLKQQDKRIIQISKLLELATSYHPSPHPTPNYNEGIRIEANNEVFTMALKEESPSLTAPWGIMSLAFSPKHLALTHAACLRSACLDLWEIFYRHSKTVVTQVLNIEEYDLKKFNKRTIKALNQTKEGKRLNHDRWLFKIKGQGVSAWTSSFTGFALNHLPLLPITLEDNSYFNEIRELGQRAKDIQSFIFIYVNSTDGFGDNFKAYVNQQLPQHVRLEAESQGKNLYKLYPNLRHHIGVEAVEKT